jgi:hypothetical protein
MLGYHIPSLIQVKTKMLREDLTTAFQAHSKRELDQHSRITYIR